MYSHYRLHELAEGYQETPFRLITEAFAGLIAMQSTGVKDKNGKEVYEGDILEDHYGHRAEIKWDTKGAGFIGFNAFTIVDDRIIGNIYENPELLT